MRNIALAILTATGIALAAPAPSFARDVAATAASRAGFDTEKLKAITAWLKADVDKGRTPGAVVLIARDGQVVLHEAVGWADKDKKIPMQRNSIHAIASSTKLITTVAALRLFEQNRLPVMAPIANYLPELKGLKISVEKKDASGAVTSELAAPARQPTVHDLMTHRAGFTYFFFPPNPLRAKYKELGIDRVDNMNADEMLQKLATLPLAFSPGTSFEYSIATDLLGHIIERVTKKPLDVALKELVLDPLKMNETTFQFRAARGALRAAPCDRSRYVGVRLARRDARAQAVFRRRGHGIHGQRLFPAAADARQWRHARRHAPALADDRSMGAGRPDRDDARRRASRRWLFLEPGQPGPDQRRRRAVPGHRRRPVLGRHHRAALLPRPKENLVGVVFVQGPSIRAAYHAELRSMVYGAMTSSKNGK